jgi:hypothetical protein
MRVFQIRVAVGAAAAVLLVSSAQAATLTALSSFGGGDGWRAPNEIIAGDSAGTATGSNYNYLQAGNLERGLAYNPATGNLTLVSRSTAGNGIRLLNGATGADVGSLNQGSGIITGGTFTTNMAAASSDGSIYVANLQSNVSTTPFKIYRWASEGAAAPTVFFNSTIPGYTGTPRHGDTLDLIGSGATTTLVAGASGVTGYSLIDSLGVATAVPTFVPAGPSAGDFRLGATFGSTAATVFGKQTAQGMEVTSPGVSLFTNVALTSAGEAPMDFAVVGGVPVLAVLDVNNSILRVYDVTNPGAPALLASGTTTSGTLTANINGAGQVRFGAFTPGGAIVYAMSTNQGIQAFQLAAVPEPGGITLAAMGLLAITVVRRVQG